jgi:phage head completion protein (GPL)|nr:MAG TPA: head completion protein [Caudoviricetes sp.]
MTGFIASLPAAQVPAETVDNEPFFPAVETTHVRDAGRLDGTTTPAMLRQAITGALIHVNEQLRPWAERQQAAGYADLQAVPAPRVAGQSRRVHAYLRAVTCATLALLENTRRAQATLPAGLGKDARVLESVGLRIDDHWQAARHAIADVQGTPRETVQLI